MYYCLWYNDLEKKIGCYRKYSVTKVIIVIVGNNYVILVLKYYLYVDVLWHLDTH